MPAWWLSWLWETSDEVARQGEEERARQATIGRLLQATQLRLERLEERVTALDQQVRVSRIETRAALISAKAKTKKRRR